MKTTLLVFLLSFSFVQSNGQCSESLFGFGNNPDNSSYNVSGDVSLTLNANNTITLNLESNFSRSSVPDVRAFLVDSNGISDAVLATTLIANLNHFEIGITNASGKQSYTVEIPEGKDITNFDKVFFYCLQYDHFWDLGTFNKFTSSNYSILNIDSLSIDKISIYPNPAENQIQLSNIEGFYVEVRIYNLLGKQVFYQSQISNESIDISSLSKGIYLLKMNTEGKSKTQKLVIQ